MNFSVIKSGAVLAVVLSGGGLGWRATPSESGLARTAYSRDAAAGLDADAVLFATEPHAAVAPMPSVTGASPETFESPRLPEAATHASNVLDRPPVSPHQSPSSELPTPWEPALAATLPMLAEPPTQAVSPQDGLRENVELRQPQPITESEARDTVMNMFGGEAARWSEESDMAHAYAAARRALRMQGIPLELVKTLAVVDFTLPSFDRRLAIYDPVTGEESRHLVAHGHHTGELYAESFSNTPRSLQSSPGLYRVGQHYNGEHGLAIRLHGLQKYVNDQAYVRGVVIHAAWYVSYKTILENQLELGIPRIGRSHGCPAVSGEDLPLVLEKLQPGSYLFIHPAPRFVPGQPEGVGGIGGLPR